MAADFDPTLSTPRDRARLALGDVGTPPNGFLLENETYDAVLLADPSEEPPVEAPMTAAYVRLARSLASVCANRAVSVKQGTTQRQWIDRAAHYKDLAALWKEEGVPDDPQFQQAGQLAQVGRLPGPNVDVLNRATGLGSAYPYPPLGKTYLP